MCPYFARLDDAIPVFQPHVDHRSAHILRQIFKPSGSAKKAFWGWTCILLNSGVKASNLKIVCVCDHRWMVELSGSVDWAKPAPKGFRGKNRDPRPIQSLLQPITLLLLGLADLDREACLSCTSIHPSIHPSTHPHIHSSILPFILRRPPPKRLCCV